MILIVDDFRDGADALCRLLTHKGYPCRWVPSGREALALLRSHPPEQPLLVILDEMMPEMSGIEVLREIRHDPKIASTPIVFHSAGFDLAKRDEAITLGVLAWLLKGGTGNMEVTTLIKEIGKLYERVGGASMKPKQETPAQ